MCILNPAANGYIQQYGGRSRRFIAVPREGNCTEGTEYHHISILSFMQNKIQEVVANNIEDESLWCAVDGTRTMDCNPFCIASGDAGT
jgi:hypothetical protein